MPEEALPWIDLEPSVELDNDVASVYFFLPVDRPDSVLAALRTIAQAPGVALVHCAAGKDRTGTSSRWLSRWPMPNARRSSMTTPRVRIAWRDRRKADGLADVRRQPARTAVVLTPESPRDHDQLSPHIERPSVPCNRMLIKMGWTAEDNDQLRSKLLF
jgi:hypothetical protein